MFGCVRRFSSRPSLAHVAGADDHAAAALLAPGVVGVARVTAAQQLKQPVAPHGPPIAVRRLRRAATQLVVAPALDHLALVEHEDQVGVAGEQQVVRDHQRRAAAHQVADRGGELGVEARGRLVEHEHGGVGEQRAGDRDPLPLAAGQPPAALAEVGVVAVGQPLDELVRAGGPRRRLDLGRRRVRPRVGDVLAHAAVQHQGLLQQDGDRSSAATRAAGPAGRGRRAGRRRRRGRRSAAACARSSTCRRRTRPPAPRARRAPRAASRP